MKYFIFALFCLASSCISAQNIQRQIKMADNSLSEKEIKKIDPSFLDTILRQNEDGSILMQIAVRKGLDTTFVENPLTGKLTKTVSDPRKPAKTSNNEDEGLPKDTAYVEDPLTGELHMFVMTRMLPSGNWKLNFFENEQDEEMERLTMEFDISGSEKSISGNDGCNAYGAKITKLTIYEIAFGPARSTKRACLLPAKYAEPFYKLLGEITQYDCTGKILNLKDAKGYTRMQFKKAE